MSERGKAELGSDAAGNLRGAQPGEADKIMELLQSV